MDKRAASSLDLSGKEHPPNSLYIILRPMFTIMQAFGLAHSVGHIHSTDNDKSSRPPRCSLSKLYAIGVLLLLWQNVGRLFIMYEANDFASLESGVLLKMVGHLWNLFNAMNATFVFVMFSKTDKFRRLFQFAGELQCKLCGCPVVCNCGRKRYISHRLVIILCITAVAFAINVGGFVYAMFSAQKEVFNLFSSLLTPFHKTEWITTESGLAITVKLLFAINTAFNTAAWLLPIMLFVILCYYIVNMEMAFATKMEETFPNNQDDNDDRTFNACGGGGKGALDAPPTAAGGDRQLSVRLLEMRLYFLKICDSIEVANGLFQNLLGVDIGILVTMLCLLVYSFVNSTTTTAYITFFLIFWILNVSGHLLIISYGGGLINDKAYEFEGVLHRIHALNTNRDDEFQLNIFLAKLRGAPVGFTAFDLFTIDKPSILTIFGMVLSYVLFMVGLNQNNSSGGATTCALSSLNATS